ncbi:interferon-induced very large GTPase 1-like [Lacerta agilis]|uniref:interferon-induced very large GTPase 1-like n=1 Tax=Lacerta agilis TaxID=80427 RepID=UPI0014196BC9|nr:interferon-induced very large GTPase 1-like [Lacerta agilis]
MSSYEIMRKGRKQLIDILQKEIDCVLDELRLETVITKEEYEGLEKIEDSKEKSRELLILIQEKGEATCHQFLEWLEVTCPASKHALQVQKHNETQNPLQSSGSVLKSESHPEHTDASGSLVEKTAILSHLVDSLGEHSLPKEKDDSPGTLLDANEDVFKDCSVGEEEGEIQKPPEEEKMDLEIGCPSQEKEDYVQEEFEEENQHPTTERRKAVMDILRKLNLEKQKSKVLSLQEVLKISLESLKEFTPQTQEDLPWHFLRKILALNVTARSTSFEEVVSDDQVLRRNEGGERIDKDIFFTHEMGESHSVNPLDVLCAVLLCSDSFLQQEIFFKMSMCQFALPLLLPPLETPKCTLMLWAMRDIVKIWRPHSLVESRGFREESLVLTSMPTISFVRMGSLSFSKSKLLSEFLSPVQQHHDFFFHRDMECGDIPREIAGGLVEIAWYFPGGQKSSDLFQEPIAVANLRGDIESNWVQFSFLTQVSSAVFIFAEAIDERQHELLSSLKVTSTQFYFILDRDSNKCREALGFLDKLAPILNLCNSNILVQSAKRNKAEFVRKLRSTVRGILNSHPTCMSVQGMCAVACELAIQADVDGQECQNALQCAEGITAEIKDVARYKQEMLRLQGDPWKDLAKVEKELCRMKRQGDKPSEKYRSELNAKWVELRKQQSQCELTTGLMKFVDAISHLKSAEKHYFLKWMKFNLDHIAREKLSKLRAEYKEKYKTSGDDTQKTAEIDRLISSSSLGVEHFMRELGQFYEAECSMVNEGKTAKHKRQFVHFPSIAADLMLEGFPLELMDGDASNIPLKWVSDVLTELHKKLRGRSKMKVITVLGVQSTGKSTLLNTMFGLQFAVSSGRCTRGAFMTLLNVRENLAQDLGCDFILVIDTEGLKAPELAKLEDSYQHDNELATLVIGLSDITIVNMAMENATEMKDILQIVTHAFLRMEEIGQSPSCQFVHQNVSDVSAHDQNMRDRKHLLEQLNEMTQAAAKMENVGRDIKFSDIMDYDPEMNNWYIPGLWHGVPPMAPVNRGYSEKVFDLKKCLFEFLRDHAHDRASKNILDFIEWMRSLWKAVKHENFIFSFQNSLIAEAYNNLSIKYSEWDRDFRREVHLWVSEQETLIQNVSPDKIAFSNLKCELQKKLSCGEEQILESLNKYFGSKAANLHLVEKYKEDFVRSANSLKRELENYSSNKLRDAIQIRKGLHKIDALQAEYKKTTEGKVDRLLEKCRGEKRKLKEKELKREFEKMWRETLLEIPPISLEKREIYAEVESYLRKNFCSHLKLYTQKLAGKRGLLSYRIHTFETKNDHVQVQSPFWKRIFQSDSQKECLLVLTDFANSLLSKCTSYIDEKLNSKGDYDETYCIDLLCMIKEELQQPDVQNLHTTPGFEVDLKLHVLGEAAHAFQRRHEEFVKENDPHMRLGKLKPYYFAVFRDLYQEKDAHQIQAKDFCEMCLYPAIVNYVNNRLGVEIMDNFHNSEQSIDFGSRSFFQFTILKDLLNEWDFDQYVEYITTYEKFVKSWIWKRIVDYYKKNEDLKNLEEKILSAILDRIRKTLNKLKHQGAATISEFVENFSQEMQKELVIPKDRLVGTHMKQAFDPGDFFAFVESFLPNLEEQVLHRFRDLDIKSKLSKLPVKPQDEIFKQMFGCGKQCPFCYTPCEAGGSAHREHFATIHRPQGFGRFRYIDSEKLICSLCSTDVSTNRVFRNQDTNMEWHPYKDYRAYYPDWRIQPDPSIKASDYWKYIFKMFNDDFAREYNAKPADLPEDWGNITKEQALQALKDRYKL